MSGRAVAIAVIGAIFPALYVAEGFGFFAASLYGWPWFLLIGILFAVIASAHVWLLLRRIPRDKPLGPLVSLALVMGALALIALIALMGGASSGPTVTTVATPIFLFILYRSRRLLT